MVLICKRCNLEFKYKSSLKTHLSRKTICKYIDNDIDVKILLDELYDDKELTNKNIINTFNVINNKIIPDKTNTTITKNGKTTTTITKDGNTTTTNINNHSTITRNIIVANYGNVDLVKFAANLNFYLQNYEPDLDENKNINIIITSDGNWIYKNKNITKYIMNNE